jgi:hypothetical protein
MMTSSSITANRPTATALLALAMVAAAAPAAAQPGSDGRTIRWEVEGGVVGTRNMEIRGFGQPSATEGWSGLAPTARIEAWSVAADGAGWNWGVALQPLYVRYSERLTANLDAKGQTFTAGAPATLDYQFHTLRFTGNRRVLASGDGKDWLRLGASVAIRYADISLRSGDAGFRDTNLIAIPLLNVESRVGLGGPWAWTTRADLLPSPEGKVFLDGLFDVYTGVRRDLGGGQAVDVGVRLFFGGYDPKTPNDYANRIFFNAVVARYLW